MDKALSFALVLLWFVSNGCCNHIRLSTILINSFAYFFKMLRIDSFVCVKGSFCFGDIYLEYQLDNVINIKILNIYDSGTPFYKSCDGIRFMNSVISFSPFL